MKYLAASAYSVSFIQLVSLIGTLFGLFTYNLNISHILLILLGYFLYSGIGISLMMHRFFTHRSFEFKSKTVENICTWISVVSGRGSPIGWVYVHRLHHAFSDTDKDPHDPKRYSWRIFFPHMLNYGETVDKRLIKDLFNHKHLKINKYYNFYILVYWLLLLSVSVEFFIFFYCIPMFLSALALDLFVYLSHSYGYRNHETRDNSKNNWFISLILWGEGWHNNHHHHAGAYTTQEKWYEIDLLRYVIEVVRK